MSFVNTLLSGRGRLVTHLTGWGLAFGVFFLMLNGITGWKEALGRTTMNNCFLAVLFYFNAKVLVNRFLEKGKYKTWAALTIPFWIGMAGLRTWAELNLFGGTIFTHNRLPRDGGWMIFVVFLSVYFLMLVFSALYQFLENRYMLEIQNKELRARNTEAQLNFLKAQINPHFLFNTLNNIYAAASLQHPKTPDMVLRLSDLLRYVTYDGQSEKISLSREIDQVRAYLDLFELQAENPLQIEIRQTGIEDDQFIEPMLLLPLVENAVKHGDLLSNPDGKLRFEIESSKDALFVTVSNTFDPEDTQKDQQGGVGLSNIRKRLALNYPNKHRFHTKINDRLFVAELVLLS